MNINLTYRVHGEKGKRNMVLAIKTRISTDKEMSRNTNTDNWFKVYQDRAKFEGRRLNWLTANAFEVIFTEKDYKITLIRY